MTSELTSADLRLPPGPVDLTSTDSGATPGVTRGGKKEGKDGNGLAYWDGATRETELQTQPGGTASGVVNLPTVEVRYGDSAVSAGTVNVVAVHDADNGCPTGLQYTVATFSAAGSALVALPYGEWTLTVP